MKILAISDVEDRALEKLASESPDKLKDLRAICSCGDLRPKYIEYITDSIRKDLYFVEGNHHTLERRKGSSLASFYDKDKHLEIGGINLHAHAVAYDEYIFAGFGGTMDYSGGPMQFSEDKMAKLVAKVQRKIKLISLMDLLQGKKIKRKTIVLSHAPPFGIHDKEDICHTGFKCFNDFIKKNKPVVWLHGHIHFQDQTRHQESIVENTKIINVFGSKIIEISGDGITSKNIYEI
ncbi:MAG: metallophosphoesterase [Elusimicrobia bacterium]|nr:metallophosphoesterase [Elusimicrobiota bacterium]